MTGSDVFAEDLAARVARLRRLAATPGYDGTIDPASVDVEAWNLVGDPLAEALISEMRDRRSMGGDIFAGARRLEGEGVEAAVRFFADVEAVPSWADFEAMRVGAEMGLRNPVGQMFASHGALVIVFIDPAMVRVLNGTGRWQSSTQSFRRRFWETAVGFNAALDVDGMKPGGTRWEQWVRIRLLHTMIRLGVQRSGRWDIATSVPISQAATASFAHVFGSYRVGIFRAFGGSATEEEERSSDLMWRWIARIQGVNAELLGTTQEECLQICERIHQQTYAPNDSSRALTASVLDGFASIRIFCLPRRVHAAIARLCLSEPLMQTLAGRDVPSDLGIPTDQLAATAARVLRTVSRLLNQLMRPKVIRWLVSKYGLGLYDAVTKRGLGGGHATFRATPVAGDPG